MAFGSKATRRRRKNPINPVNPVQKKEIKNRVQSTLSAFVGGKYYDEYVTVIMNRSNNLTILFARAVEISFFIAALDGIAFVVFSFSFCQPQG